MTRIVSSGLALFLFMAILLVMQVWVTYKDTIEVLGLLASCYLLVRIFQELYRAASALIRRLK